jgi:hypothetical protein
VGAIKIDTFGGMQPSVDNRLLPDRAAAHSENAWMYTGTLSGVPQLTLVRANAAGTGKVYRIPDDYAESGHINDSTWLEFGNPDTDVVRALVIDDDFDRYYWASPSSDPMYNTAARLRADTVNDEFTKALLHFNGADASTTITDDNFGGSAHTWTAAGNAQLDTAVTKLGSATLLCDGTGDYVSTPDHADFALGSGAFTIDLWFNCTATTGSVENLAGQTDASATDTATSFYIYRTAADLMEVTVYVGATATTVTSTTTFTDAVNAGWHHLAAVRSGDVLTLYIDGVAEDSAALVGTVNNSAEALAVGRAGAVTTDTWTGSIDEFHLSVGVARWTDDFDVPTTEWEYTGSWLLGIPAPAAASVVVTGGTGLLVSRAYVTTWVSAYGEEGPASDPVLATDNIDGSWDLTLTGASSDDLGGVGDDRYLTKVRIYRTVTSATGVTTYFLVVEQDISDTTYSDTSDDADIVGNNELVSTNWTAPPDDLEGFIAMPNGILAGWRNNEVWFCEPFRPHAWPAAYTLVVDYPIVGLGVIGQTLVVCTRGHPVAITGIHPASMSQSKSSMLEPCLSRGSILSTPEGVYYASPNGLILADSSQVRNITRQLVTKDKWATIISNSTLRAGRLGSAYYAFGGLQDGVFDPESFDPLSFSQEDFTGAYTGVLFDPQNERVAFNLLSSTVPTTSVQNDPWSGELFVLRDDNTYKLDLSAQSPIRQVYKWRSKVFQSGRPTNMGAMKIYWEAPDTAPDDPGDAPFVAGSAVEFPELPDGSTYGVVRAYADDELVWTRNLLASGELMKLPTGFKASYWQFEIEAYVDVFSMQVASSAKELSKV